MIVKCKRCLTKYERFNIGEYGYPYLCNNCLKCVRLYSALLFALVLIVILVQTANADNIQSLGTIKQGDSILLKQNCVNVTYVNITSISISGLKTKELLSSSISMSLIYQGYQTYLFSNTSYQGQNVEYIVTGICDENGLIKPWSYNFYATPSGENFDLVGILTYLFFLIVCLISCVLSIRLFKNSKFSKDVVKNYDLYQQKKRNEFIYYMKLLKQKFWIVGVFGVYLSLLIFFALLDQLVYNLGLTDLHNILGYVTLGFAWGLVPFTIFWIAYLIIVFYQSTVEIMRYQFGAIGGREK